MLRKFWNLEFLCRFIATNKNDVRKSQSGFSIVETMIAMTLLAVIIAGVASFSRYSSRGLMTLRAKNVAENIEKNIRATASNAANISLSSSSSGTLRACLDIVQALQGKIAPTDGGCAPMTAPQSFALQDQNGNKLAGSTFDPRFYDYSGVACAAGTPNCLIRAETAYQLICPANEPACSKASTVRTFFRISAQSVAKGNKPSSLSSFQSRSGMIDMPLSNIKMISLGNVKCDPGMTLTGITSKGEPLCLKNASTSSKTVGLPLTLLPATLPPFGVPSTGIVLGELTENVSNDEVLMMLATADLPCPCLVNNYGGNCDPNGSCGFTNGKSDAEDLLEIKEIAAHKEVIGGTRTLQKGVDKDKNPIFREQTYLKRTAITNSTWETKSYKTACYLNVIFRVSLNNQFLQYGQSSTCEGNFRFTYSLPKNHPGGNVKIKVEAIYGGRSNQQVSLISADATIPHIYIKDFNLTTLKFPKQKFVVK
jgi:prepilin-type N-terminal cleavage/methylation domain-containing protein